MLMKNSTISATSAFYIGLSLAAQANEGCKITRYVAVFGNGVLTYESDAHQSKRGLGNAVLEKMDPEKAKFFRTDIAYNPTNGLADFFEAVIQSIDSDISRFFDIFNRVIPMPEAFKNAYTKLSTKILSLPDGTNDLIKEHVLKYKTLIAEGNKVVIVSHSQGNFFANKAYSYLTTEEKKSLSIVGVAVPDTYIAGRNNYVTVLGDVVIDAIRVTKAALGLPLPLPSNTAGGPTLRDLSGHYFSKTYLRDGSSSKSKIVSKIIEEFDRLSVNSNPGNQGPITVTLTWGAQPDVDLHVYEPNGTHVYYENKSGSSGRLDIDDTNGNGPEHYYVSCSSLRIGSYRIGVNYYEGSRPETAKVNVLAGTDINKSFTKRLTRAVGSAGNASPIPIADIIVSKDAAGNFIYAVVAADNDVQEAASLAAYRKFSKMRGYLSFKK